jgi:hypothetical protein
MPGTLDARKLGDEQAITDLFKGKLQKGFAVGGTAKQALVEARDVMLERKNPRTSFNDDVWLVFFTTRPSSAYIHLHEVIRRPGVVRIRYRAVPHETKELTHHLAMIPVGKVPRALKVEIEQVTSITGIEKVVCQSFQIGGNNEDARNLSVDGGSGGR